MISRVESSQNWIESVTHQMNHVILHPGMVDNSLTCLIQMSYDEQSDKLAGTIGLLKQSVAFREPSPTYAYAPTGTLRAQAEKSLKMLHKFLVEGLSQ